jgi:hypothetical protein
VSSRVGIEITPFIVAIYFSISISIRMPRINTECLIRYLEDIDETLGMIWSDSQNYDTIRELELLRIKLRKIIETLETVL